MIVVRTTPVELVLYGDDYDAFVAALGREGFPAHVEEPTEYRSAGQVATELGIRLADHILEPAAVMLAVEAIKRAAAETISKRKAGRKKLIAGGASGASGSGLETPASWRTRDVVVRTL